MQVFSSPNFQISTGYVPSRLTGRFHNFNIIFCRFHLCSSVLCACSCVFLSSVIALCEASWSRLCLVSKVVDPYDTKPLKRKNTLDLINWIFDLCTRPGNEFFGLMSETQGCLVSTDEIDG